jgi:hypothetical protein
MGDERIRGSNTVTTQKYQIFELLLLPRPAYYLVCLAPAPGASTTRPPPTPSLPGRDIYLVGLLSRVCPVQAAPLPDTPYSGQTVCFTAACCLWCGVAVLIFPAERFRRPRRTAAAAATVPP